MMSQRWTDIGGGGDSSQDYTQATQEESILELDEFTQVEPVVDLDVEGTEEGSRPAEPAPWGRLLRLSGGAAMSLMPRPEQLQGRALNEVTLGRGKVCEVQVSDQRISSKHCRIYCEVVSGHLGGMEVYVEDMSANGTWINQHTKLLRGHRRLLNSGDEIALLNPYKHHKKAPAAGGSSGKEAERAAGVESGKDGDDVEKLEAEAATFTFIDLNRNRGMSRGRPGSLTISETLRAGTVPGVSSPVLRSSASGVAGIFGGARKVEDFYDVREMIGHGTSGEVRRAINRTTGKQVAVKVIETRKFALTPGLTPKELVQEAEMLKRVDHEYIIKLEDIFQTEQAVYIVMDLVSGGDLFDRIVEKGVYAEDLAQELLFRVLTAVDYLHSNDIVHRDLKPENILLVGRDNDVDVKITDFGLAKRANKEGLKTFCGTPQYFAPEVLKRRNTVLGVGRYGKEADMWSVGVILYILLSGTHPFHTTTLFDQISHASYSMVGQEWDSVSDPAKDLVSKFLTENPKDRLTASQALGHPFITERAAAANAANRITVAGTAKVAAATATATATVGAVMATTSSAGPAFFDKRGWGVSNGAGRTVKKGAAAEAATGRSSSQDTDLSSTSGPEDASPVENSLSPTEGGGGSAIAVPLRPAESPKIARLPPRGVVPDLPPPKPREPGKSGGGDRGEGRGRKRPKKDSAGDKLPPPYSQLQMHVVRVSGSEQTGVGNASQETAPRRTARTGVPDSKSTHAMSDLATPSGIGRGGMCSSSQGTGLSRPPALAPGSASNRRPKRRLGKGAHAPQCAAEASVKPSARQTAGRVVARTSVTTFSPADDDDIMDYSSDDSPVKGKRSRFGRGRQQKPTDPKSQSAVAVAQRGSAAIVTTAALAAETAAGAGGEGIVTTSTVEATGQQQQQKEMAGSQQRHLKIGDAGKLNLSKLGPLPRAGVGSASNGKAREQTSGDRVAQAAAGGAAASVDNYVEGGAPSGGGKVALSAAANRKVGKAVKGGKNSKGGSKPQRTMTHLWKRAGPGGDP